MATLKKKLNDDTLTSVGTSNVDSSEMTESEVEVLEVDGADYKDEQSKVSSEKMNKVLDLLQNEFDLKGKDFELVGYEDKGNKITATLSNSAFDVRVTIKSSEIIMRFDLDD